MAGPIGPTFGTRLPIHLGMDIGQNNLPLHTSGGIWGGLGGQKFKSMDNLPNG